jgi:hypothetical protein
MEAVMMLLMLVAGLAVCSPRDNPWHPWLGHGRGLPCSSPPTPPPYFVMSANPSPCLVWLQFPVTASACGFIYNAGRILHFLVG